MFKKYISLLFVICGVTMLSTAPTMADSPAPGWDALGQFIPTNLAPGGKGTLVLHVFNVGAARGEGTLTDILPEGLTVEGETTIRGETGSSYGYTCTVATVITCPLRTQSLNAYTEHVAGVMFPGEDVVIEIPVHVASDASGSVVDRVFTFGGGVLETKESSIPVTYGSTPAGFGFSALGTWYSNADGTIDDQAGSHPYDLTVAFAFATMVNSEGEIVPAGGQARTVNVNLPPGLVGNPRAVPQCTRIQLEREECPASSQVGVDLVSAEDLPQLVFDVYNLVPPPGVPAQFGFDWDGTNVFFEAGVRTGTDNGITEHTRNIPERYLYFNSAMIWGTPAETSHDYQRQGHNGEGVFCDPFNKVGGCASDAPSTPLLTLPTSCGAPQTFTAQIFGSWENESLVSPVERATTENSKGEPSGFTGCERLVHFEPSVSISPDTSFSDTPAGLSVSVRMPQGLNPEGLATAGLKDTTVTLPEGVAINPGQATGLVACQLSQEALGYEPNGEVNEKAPTCPAASHVGTDEVVTPLLAHPLKGNVYVLQSNPPTLQLLVTASGEGVNLKLVGTVHLNETNGQLTTTFENTPDLPFTEFTLAFSGGAQAALATPTRCGTYETNSQLTPWSTPFVESALSVSRFQIIAGPNGSPCQWPMPFAPTLTAGSTTDQAGGYTSFSMLLQRGDGQQRMERLQFKTPEGLLGMISKVPLCPEPQAAQGTCSEASQIGHTVAEAGPGPYPYVIPEAGAPPAPIYLTGPYDGAPFGLSIVVPIVAGPFNLGTEVVRAKIEVDPYTSRLTITTTAFPRTVKGVPTDIREIDAVVDRPEFMFNPTDCKPMSFSGTAYSIEGATAPLESHFQMGSCQALKFNPNFKVSTNGKTSRANGASLTAKIVYPVGNLGFNQASSQSNIKSVKVDLPKQLPSRLTTLQKACPAKIFEANPASCPAASIVGHGKAVTPLLPVPVEGPAYFVSHAGEEFPNLIVVLQGDNVTVDLIGSTFIGKAGITSSTFKEVPDVPIQTFELNLPQGKYSALAANTNLCKSKLVMPTAFTGQNGAVLHQSTPVSVTGCAKSKPKKTKVKKKGERGGKTHKVKKQ